jgi:hypothetical protein
MRYFVQRHRDQIQGVLSGFDRLRFRGTLRMLTTVRGMMAVLGRLGVLLKDFTAYAGGRTQQLRASVEAVAQQADRPVQYLPGYTNKEQLVRGIQQQQGSAPNGLVAVLSTLENCTSYEIVRDRQRRELDLRRRPRKCLHYYVYFEDSVFGLTHVRLQTWFPFDVRVVLNGREWLARQLDAAHIAYQRWDNCFPWIEDFPRAQTLANRQRRIHWSHHLDRLLRRAAPEYVHLFNDPPQRPYWTIEESEWATDLAFRSPEALAELYPALIRYAIQTFDSRDVLRFLGHKVSAQGRLHPRFAKEVLSDLRERPEGLRIKHRVGRNTLKMYDKFGRLLRVETTLNEVRSLKVFRRKGHQPNGPRQWLRLRKSVADTPRRAQLSHSANSRYLDMLAAVDPQTPLSHLADKLCQPVYDHRGRRRRALNPLSPPDAQLLSAVIRGEHALTGFRNRDVRQALYGQTPDDAERRRQAGRVTRQLTLLRAHRLIRKLPGTHRYVLTKQGQTAIPAFLAAHNATLDQLTNAA